MPENKNDDFPKQVHDVPHCPICKGYWFWDQNQTNSAGYSLLRCCECGRDYWYKKPQKEVKYD